MKFTNGYWLDRDGWDIRHPKAVQRFEELSDGLRVFAPTKYLSKRGDELDAAILTLTFKPVAEGVIAQRIEHHRGYMSPAPEFDLNINPPLDWSVSIDGTSATLNSGSLSVTITSEPEFRIEFRDRERLLTSSIPRSIGLAVSPEGKKYIHEQLTILPNEYVYGLGERFGPTCRNGQSVEMWNADGGTATEQAYKNIPFYMTNRGYGVLVNHPEKVEFEVGSEINTRVQFSVPGDFLEYLVIAGPEPKNVLDRYTALTGRPPAVPEWSYGLWLSTSFTTDYSEETIHGFVDKMDAHEIPVSVLHFDCYWMRPSHWCDFVWDPEKFPQPEAMTARLHERGIKVCVWINPYVGQQSDLWEEGRNKGYFLKRADGSVRQWDHWQSGMAWVDFTNPEATEWWKGKLKALLRQGVDAFKTDFGERVPTDVVWSDGSDPERMHNYYTHLYNTAAYEAIVEERGQEEALVFARSATVGGQTKPVHWGGDSEPTFVSMAETLRGGLSLGMSGFPYWSHDMGGFEGRPNPAVFTRWFAFGMFSSHSRLHGSSSYRVPWIYGDEAVAAAQKFSAIKQMLMPYLRMLGSEAQTSAAPFIRHMALEFPNDLGSATVETQYMFGPSILVAPVFSETGEADFYLPTRGWTSLLDGDRYDEAGWKHGTFDMLSLPVLAPDGALIPLVTADGTNVLLAVEPQPGKSHSMVFWTANQATDVVVDVSEGGISATGGPEGEWIFAVISAKTQSSDDNTANPIAPLATPSAWVRGRGNEVLHINF